LCCSRELPITGWRRLAIVGPSGAGKSTLINLLLRFWDYTEGSLQLGGQELHDLSSDDARAMFAVVSQHTHLFNVTVRDNLLLANPDASDEQLGNACHTAQVTTSSDFCYRYDTPDWRLASFERRTAPAPRYRTGLA
jgi:ATP-binding cassette subfamily C protein CydC